MPKLNGFDLQSPPATINPKIARRSKMFGGVRRAPSLPSKAQMLTAMAKSGVPVRAMAELAKI